MADQLKLDLPQEFIPQIYTSKVVHKRLIPKINAFKYSVYYLALPLSKIENLKLLRPFLSFKTKNHGKRDGSSLRDWIDGILQDHKVEADGEVVLVAMPRILGYVFNPVSFWFCFDKKANLKAVLSEVNNTFGESHSYLCVKEDHSNITGDDIFDGEKLFHVSPFIEREGSYKFRFDYSQDKLGVWIDHYNEQGEKLLITSMAGKFSELDRGNLLKHFLKYPLITIKVIGLIHYQALKLVSKGIKYIRKPEQKAQKMSEVN